MRKATYIALALCAALCSPTMARADEVNYFESFTNGIETLRGNDVSENVTPERDYEESYEPQEVVLSAPVERVLPEDASTIDYVNDTVDHFNRVTWRGDGTNSLLGTVMLFLGGTGETATSRLFMVTAVGLVFVWWGVRKAKNIIVGAFRNGRLSFGPVDRNPNSYYYGTRPSNWR